MPTIRGLAPRHCPGRRPLGTGLPGATCFHFQLVLTLAVCALLGDDLGLASAQEPAKRRTKRVSILFLLWCSAHRSTEVMLPAELESSTQPGSVAFQLRTWGLGGVRDLGCEVTVTQWLNWD